jgi:hypothetical protein
MEFYSCCAAYACFTTHYLYGVGVTDTRRMALFLTHGIRAPNKTSMAALHRLAVPNVLSSAMRLALKVLLGAPSQKGQS